MREEERKGRRRAGHRMGWSGAGHVWENEKGGEARLGHQVGQAKKRRKKKDQPIVGLG